MLRAVLLLVLAAVISLPAERKLAAQPKPRKVAFLVGVGTYDHAFADLGKLPENDVTELSKEFKAGGFDVVTLLGSGTGNDRATKANIESRYKELVDGKEPLTNRDTLIVVLCGHGFQDAEPLFVPVNARPGKPETMVRLNGLIDATKDLGVTCLFLVDACREDPNRGARATGIQGKQVVLPKKTAVLFSCGAGQLAYQDKTSGHGVFSLAVLKTIRGGDGTNWNRLTTGVQEAFQTAEIQRLLPAGETQTPVEARGELGFTPLLAKKLDDLKPGEIRKFEVADGVFMDFCWIPPGSAVLGSPKDEKERGRDEDDRPFETKGFWLGRYEVTQDEWVAVTGGPNPSYFDGKKDNKAKDMKTGRFPVETVSWNDICRRDGFLDRVNGRTGASTAFGRVGKFCLPTEGEWEYAARGGHTDRRPFYWGSQADGSQSNCNGNHPYATDKKGRYLARPCAVDDAGPGYPRHPWNLAHMHGNVWELCHNKREQSAEYMNVCGGSWAVPPFVCRAAQRIGNAPGNRHMHLGFRLCFRLD